MSRNIKIATILALSTAIFSGFANFVNKMAMKGVGDPVFFTTLKNSVVAIFLIGIIIFFKKWKEIKGLRKDQLFKLTLIGIIGGSLPFILFFVGLTKIPAINAALIHKTLFIWIALLAIPFLKEKFTNLQWLGVGLIFSANFVIGGFNGFEYGLGELMVLGATMLWAVENIIAKITLRDVSSSVVAGSRMIFGSVILFSITLFRGSDFSILSGFSAGQWFFVTVVSLLLLGYVLTWYKAIQLAPVTYVAILLTPATLVTNLLSAIFVTHTMSLTKIISGILVISGTILLIWQYNKLSKKEEEIESCKIC